MAENTTAVSCDELVEGLPDGKTATDNSLARKLEVDRYDYIVGVDVIEECQKPESIMINSILSCPLSMKHSLYIHMSIHRWKNWL